MRLRTSEILCARSRKLIRHQDGQRGRGRYRTLNEIAAKEAHNKLEPYGMNQVVNREHIIAREFKEESRPIGLLPGSAQVRSSHHRALDGYILL